MKTPGGLVNKKKSTEKLKIHLQAAFATFTLQTLFSAAHSSLYLFFALRNKEKFYFLFPQNTA